MWVDTDLHYQNLWSNGRDIEREEEIEERRREKKKIERIVLY